MGTTFDSIARGLNEAVAHAKDQASNRTICIVMRHITKLSPIKNSAI